MHCLTDFLFDWSCLSDTRFCPPVDDISSYVDENVSNIQRGLEGLENTVRMLHSMVSAYFSRVNK